MASPDRSQPLVFTNGCFDILHAGHVSLLRRARELGGCLVVGLNSDASITRLKGPTRPINNCDDRKAVLEAIRWVDRVEVFDDDTPLDLIKKLQPDMLVKGGDWPVDQIVGAEFVQSMGGSVYSLPLVEGKSTTGILANANSKSR